MSGAPTVRTAVAGYRQDVSSAPVSAAPPASIAFPSTRFDLPAALAATEPPEARGLERDGVRLLIGSPTSLDHARFRDLGSYLRAGDLLVVNTSGTRASAVEGSHARLGPVVVHFSTQLDDASWVLELRTPPSAASPVRDAAPGDRVTLPGGFSVILIEPYPTPGSTRLWRVATAGWVSSAGSVSEFLAAHGRPIRYGYLSGEWPLSAYQTVFTGLFHGDGGLSAEMPSAGRPFSRALVNRLRRQGIRFAPISLHAGVSSPEHDEPPMPEPYTVPPTTASMVNLTRKQGGRVVAVGTTVTRALETGSEPGGRVRAGHGWTDLVLGPDRPVRAVDGLVTGLHDPDASHLLLLEAVAGADLVQQVYDAALDRRYLWHEFGDSCLLLR